jgi:acetyl-CoA carboxylase carboxyltransferase component
MSLDELERARRALLDEARPDAVAGQHERNKLTARERLALLLDEGSAIEYGAFATPDANEKLLDVDVPAEGLVTCTGTIDGRPVSTVAIDFTVLGGSNGNAGVAKIIRMARLSLERGYPHIVLLDGGGHRMQEMDGREFATGGPSAFREQALMSGWTPQVGAIMGPAFAGPAVQAAFCDFVPIVEGTGSIGVAGRSLVRAAVGSEVPRDEFGGAVSQMRNGMVDLVVDDDRACLDAIKEFLSYLPSNAAQAPPVAVTDDPPDRSAPELRDVVPARRRQAYDVVTVLRSVVDNADVFELRGGFGRSVVTAFARLDGRAVGLIATQPMVLAGALDRDACIKVARFASMCDAYGLPLVTFIDSPGLLVGPDAEEQNVLRYATKVLSVLGHATVPIVSVVLRKAYGVAYLALAGGRSWNAEACFVWPSAEVCPMSIEGAVDLADRKRWESADDPRAAREELIAEGYSRTTPLRAASGFGVDDVIDPASTRQKIAAVLHQNEGRRRLDVPPKRHAVEPI